MVLFPNAKINIGLFVTEKRPDGYHNLESIFYPVRWKDVLEIVPSDVFSFSTSGLSIDGNPDNNLCVQAYNLLRKDFDLPNIAAHLHKVIPMGAGMGGGSSDGAFMLKLLNSQFELGLSHELLQNYARKLGSDCAFFVENKPVFAFEKGDIFKNIELDLSQYEILCVYPNLHVTTGQAYGGIVPAPASFDLTSIPELPIESWKDHVRNDFETHIFQLQPELAQIKNTLYSKGALYASMSGSGSTIFGIFDRKIDPIEAFDPYEVMWV